MEDTDVQTIGANEIPSNRLKNASIATISVHDDEPLRGQRLCERQPNQKLVLLGNGIGRREALEELAGRGIKLAEAISEQAGRSKRRRVQVAENAIGGPCAMDGHDGFLHMTEWRLLHDFAIRAVV